MRPNESTKTELQPAPDVKALLQCPCCDKQAGNTGVLATQVRHKHPDSNEETGPKMEIKYPCAVKLEAQQEEEKIHTKTLLPQMRRMLPRHSALCAQNDTYTSVHKYSTVADSMMAKRSGRREGATHPATTPRWDRHRSNFAVQHAAFGATAVTDWPTAAQHATGVDLTL
ncbi:hypothetical protein TcYC6_0116360 [Trypanosoma cruzi]|nr:hypothetical protein TcYC6_0116360 [Trypanosoma cruzi]